MFHWFDKTLPVNPFYILLVNILHLEKKERNIHTSILEFTFLGEDVIKRGTTGQGKVIIKRGRWNI